MDKVEAPQVPVRYVLNHDLLTYAEVCPHQNGTRNEARDADSFPYNTKTRTIQFRTNEDAHRPTRTSSWATYGLNWKQLFG